MMWIYKQNKKNKDKKVFCSTKLTEQLLFKNRFPKSLMAHGHYILKTMSSALWQYVCIVWKKKPFFFYHKYHGDPSLPSLSLPARKISAINNDGLWSSCSCLGDHSVHAPSQWEIALQCDAISPWMGTYNDPCWFICWQFSDTMGTTTLEMQSWSVSELTHFWNIKSFPLFWLSNTCICLIIR